MRFVVVVFAIPLYLLHARQIAEGMRAGQTAMDASLRVRVREERAFAADRAWDRGMCQHEEFADQDVAACMPGSGHDNRSGQDASSQGPGAPGVTATAWMTVLFGRSKW